MADTPYDFTTIDGAPQPRTIRLTKAQEEKLIRFMHQTRQACVHLLFRGDHLRVTIHDGATNNEQEPGYHDYLRVEVLPLPVELPWL